MCTPAASRPWIRLRWRLPCVGLFGHPVEGHWLWEPDTPSVRAAFQAAVEAGNKAHGAGTHWMEQEEAEAAPDRTAIRQAAGADHMIG